MPGSYVGLKYDTNASQKEGKPRKEDIYAAPLSQLITAAKGQLLTWQLTLVNRSRLPVTGARVTVVVPDLPEREKARAMCESRPNWCKHSHASLIRMSEITGTVQCIRMTL